MPPIQFTKDDFDNLEMVRQIVFRRLKDDRNFNLFYQRWDSRTQQYVIFGEPQAHVQSHFELFADEILWQLFIQGVITPGKEPSNPDLPWFRLTNYGKKVLAAERFIPHDPTGYLDDVKGIAKSDVGQAALPYLEEALRCFTSGCNVSSVLMLGISAEAVFLKLCIVITARLKQAAERKQFERLLWVKPKHEWVVNKYKSIPISDRKKLLPESLDTTLTALYDLIRRQRNELGHPQEQPPDIDRDKAYMYLKLFPTFISDVEAFVNYCKKHKI